MYIDNRPTSFFADIARVRAALQGGNAELAFWFQWNIETARKELAAKYAAYDPAVNLFRAPEGVKTKRRGREGTYYFPKSNDAVDPTVGWQALNTPEPADQLEALARLKFGAHKCTAAAEVPHIGLRHFEARIASEVAHKFGL